MEEQPRQKKKKMHSPGMSEFSIEVEEDWQLRVNWDVELCRPPPPPVRREKRKMKRRRFKLKRDGGGAGFI